MELQSKLEEDAGVKRSDVDSNDVTRKKRTKKSFIMKKLSCFRSTDYGYPTIEAVDGHGNVDMESASTDKDHYPTHLVVMVNGLIGSAQNWRFAAKQFLKKYPQDLIVHCSKCNSALKTLDGIDVMGSRLADEVISVIERHPNLQKISFIGHSLGGLISRYAIAKLYTQDHTNQSSQENGDYNDYISNGKIAGMEPINFITVASPHLGSRGHRQVPMFCGVRGLERLGYHTSGLVRRTGRHLFLKDKANGQTPLLVQMVDDSEDLKFIFALQSFRRRVVYANALSDRPRSFDKQNPLHHVTCYGSQPTCCVLCGAEGYLNSTWHIDLVGWSTSSIRRRSELPKLKNLVRSGRYPHILKEGATNTTKQETSMDPQANSHKTKTVTATTTATMEETMIRGLSKLSWERVDVSFKGSKQRYLAHNTIQVNTPWMNSDGADVIQHMVDNFLV